MNLNEEIQKATDKFIEEKLPKLVEEKVTKMVDSILDDVFRSYSDTGKQIKDKIEKQLNVNLQNYDLVDYNAMVAKTINDRLVQVLNEDHIKSIHALVNDTIGFISKKEIKLSEIHELFREASMDDNESDMDGEFSFHVEINSEHKWVTIYADIDKGVDKNDCGIELLINQDSGHIFLMKSRNYWSSKSKLTPFKVTQLSNLEHKMFRLYSAQVKVIFDEYDFDNQWYRHD